VELSTRWIGEATYGHKAKDGDLLVCAIGPTAYLCLKTSSSSESYALVLAEFGDETGDPVPRLVYSATLIDNHVIQKLPGSGFVIEALGEDANELFAPPIKSPSPNGSLAILADGRRVIRISGERSLSYVVVGSGALLEAISDPKVWLKSWRLLWTFGEDDQKELCRFPAPPKEKAAP
jgi:hypothetical protein